MEQNYEFLCQACGRRTAIILPPRDMLNIRAVDCSFCGSDKMLLTAYYRDLRDYIAQIQSDLNLAARQIDALADEGDIEHDVVFDN